MRATAIPAQITTVEDRIVGNLNLSQLLLLCVPIFTGGLLYAALPPIMTITVYKLLVMAMLAVICGLLAIRVKGIIALQWAAILVRYWLRPRYYVFDKHSTHGRKQYRKTSAETEEAATTITERSRARMPLKFEDMAKVQELIANPAANVAFETKKGGLYVRITEIKQEG